MRTVTFNGEYSGDFSAELKAMDDERTMKIVINHCFPLEKIKYIPDRVKILCIDSCDISKLSNFPKNLQVLMLSNIGCCCLKKLPHKLPDKMISLFLYEFQIEKLDDLPDNLKILDFERVQISELILPKNLERFDKINSIVSSQKVL